jgi:hypothetical protein
MIMFAADLPIILLGVSAIVLVASTVLLSISLPTLSWPRLRRHAGRHRHQPIQATHRRIVTGSPAGRPAPHSPLALPPVDTLAGPRRQTPTRPDIHEASEEVTDAVATIEHLLDTDPQHLARLMMQWIRESDTTEMVYRSATEAGPHMGDTR